MPQQFNSLSDALQFMSLPKPVHPLITVINSAKVSPNISLPVHSHVLQFYKISYRPQLSPKIKYGQGYYDFNEGGLLFASPNQVIGSQEDKTVQSCSLYTLLIHPDFLWNYPLAKKMKQYGFFSYSTHEALHLSDQEKTTILSIFEMIETELNNRIDDFSQDVIISQIELLLNYASRFYKRQFITRKAVNNDLLQQLDEILIDYFDNNQSLNQGIPTVQFLAEKLNVSPNYLSDMLRSLTGCNAQQHIHNKLMDKAKVLLSTTGLSVSAIAFQLGFEHPQSFSRFFKTKARQSPLEFRQSFH